MIPQANTISLTEATEAELWRRLRAGEEAAFLVLYRRMQGGIYRFALRMSGSAAMAEDVTQETFMILLQGNGGYEEGKGSFRAYLFGIARNQILRRFEKERGVVPLELNEEERAAPMPPSLITVDDPLQSLARQERIALIRQAVLSLPPHYREVVVLCDLHEMSYQEAAEVLACALGTVRSRLHRARGLLLDRFRGTELEPTTGTDPWRCFV